MASFKSGLWVNQGKASFNRSHRTSYLSAIISTTNVPRQSILTIWDIWRRISWPWNLG